MCLDGLTLSAREPVPPVCACPCLHSACRVGPRQVSLFSLRCSLRLTERHLSPVTEVGSCQLSFGTRCLNKPRRQDFLGCWQPYIPGPGRSMYRRRGLQDIDRGNTVKSDGCWKIFLNIHTTYSIVG